MDCDFWPFSKGWIETYFLSIGLIKENPRTLKSTSFSFLSYLYSERFSRKESLASLSTSKFTFWRKEVWHIAFRGLSSSCFFAHWCQGFYHWNHFFVSFPDGYTVSDVVMYWREEPVVGVDKAELPQFTIVRWETNERKIRLATGMSQNQGKQSTVSFTTFFLIRYIPTFIAFFQVATQYWLLCVSNISSINLNRDAFLGLILDQPWSYQCQSSLR